MDMNTEFLKKTSKLNPVQFAGLAKFMGVKLYNDEDHKDARDAYEILEEIMERYAALPRRERRTLLHNLNAGNS